MRPRSPRSLGRIASSLVRLRVGRPLATAPLAPGGPLVQVDLRQPLGLGHYRYGNTVAEVALITRLLSPGATFIDGGANVGVFSLFAARAVGPSGRVIAIEAAPATFALLRRNVELNGLCNVELVGAALGASSGSVEFVAFGAGSGLSSFAPADVSGGEAIRVPVQTLDEVAANVSSPCVVKLDIEGAEMHALRGAAALLTGVRPDLLLEVDARHLARQGSDTRELRELLTSAGYGWCPHPGTPDHVVELTVDAWPDQGETVNVLVRPLSRRPTVPRRSERSAP